MLASGAPRLRLAAPLTVLTVLEVWTVRTIEYKDKILIGSISSIDAINIRSSIETPSNIIIQKLNSRDIFDRIKPFQGLGLCCILCEGLGYRNFNSDKDFPPVSFQSELSDKPQ